MPCRLNRVRGTEACSARGRSAEAPKTKGSRYSEAGEGTGSASPVCGVGGVRDTPLARAASSMIFRAWGVSCSAVTRKRAWISGLIAAPRCPGAGAAWVLRGGTSMAMASSVPRSPSTRPASSTRS